MNESQSTPVALSDFDRVRLFFHCLIRAIFKLHAPDEMAQDLILTDAEMAIIRFAEKRIQLRFGDGETAKIQQRQNIFIPQV